MTVSLGAPGRPGLSLSISISGAPPPSDAHQVETAGGSLAGEDFLQTAWLRLQRQPACAGRTQQPVGCRRRACPVHGPQWTRWCPDTCSHLPACWVGRRACQQLQECTCSSTQPGQRPGSCSRSSSDARSTGVLQCCAANVTGRLLILPIDQEGTGRSVAAWGQVRRTDAT